MASKKKNRIDLFLNCSECAKTKNDQGKPKRQQNYRTSRSKNPQAEKLNLKKYCKFCQKIVAHKEETIRRSY